MNSNNNLAPQLEEKEQQQQQQQQLSPALIQLRQIIMVQNQQIQRQLHQIMLQNQQLLCFTSQIQALKSEVTSLQGQLQLFQKHDPKDQKYGSVRLGNLIFSFINSFESLKTRTTYTEGFNSLIEQRFIDPNHTLREFKEINGENLLDQVRQNYKAKRNGKYFESSHSTRQLRCAMILSFSKYLQRKTESYLTQITANRMSAGMTFSHRRRKTAASKLNQHQIDCFLAALKGFSLRGYIFANLQIFGCRRMSEIINCHIADLDLDNKRIFFRPLKKKNVVVEPIAIYLPSEFISLIKEYVKDRSQGFLFTSLPATKSAQDHDKASPITKNQIAKIYHRGWNKAIIADKENNDNTTKIFRPQLITHCLRSYGISSLYSKKFDSVYIKEISGHESVDMTNYYRYADPEENITKKLHTSENCDKLK